MQFSRLFFINAIAIHTIVPILIGVILLCSTLFVIEVSRVASPPPANGSGEIGSQIADNKSRAAMGIILAIGMIGVIAAIAVAGQLMPCFIMSLALTILATRLIPISKTLYIIAAIFIGSSGAALWFYKIGPGGLHVTAGLLTFFAAIGYLLSSTLVCLLRKL